MFPNRSGDDDPEVVTIIGRKEKAEAAKNHLQKLIKDLVRLSLYEYGLSREREGEGGREGGRERWRVREGGREIEIKREGERDLVMVVSHICTRCL